MQKKILTLFIFVLLLSFFPNLARGETTVISFFYSKTCSHCAAEKVFLEKLEKEYNDLKIKKYLISEKENQKILAGLYEKYNVDPRYRGLVPITFIKDYYIIGFDNERETGNRIRQAIEAEIKNGEHATGAKTAILPLIGEVEVGQYSLLALTLIMGLLDGFNVCSLGALVLILGLVLNLRSRRKIIFYGGLFVLVTSMTYGTLIVVWYKAFSLLSSYLRAMEMIIGSLSVIGSIYFFREFLRFRKKGVVCDSGGKKFGSKSLNRIQNVISDKENIKPLALAGSIFLFAFIISVVEFPCSAAVPVVYAGILADAHLPSLLYLLYIFIFVIFYMLDELIVFAVASWKMSVWTSSPKFTKWVTLVQAIALLGLGGLYLFGF